MIRDGVNARHIINPTEGCEPLDVTFADTSIYTASLDTIVSVEWFFGNGIHLFKLRHRSCIITGMIITEPMRFIM